MMSEADTIQLVQATGRLIKRGVVALLRLYLLVWIAFLILAVPFVAVVGIGLLFDTGWAAPMGYGWSVVATVVAIILPLFIAMMSVVDDGPRT